jgi:hypothetical protein
MEPCVHLHDGPAHREHPGREVDVPRPQFSQLAPAQAGLDVRLRQEPHYLVGQRLVDAAELLGRDDRARFLRHGRRLDAPARVQEYDLIVHGGREDGAQEDLVVSNGHRRDALRTEPGNPGADMLGQDVDHPHGPEFGHQILVDRVRVALPGRCLDLVARQPHLLHVRLERLPPATGIA